MNFDAFVFIPENFLNYSYSKTN